jgi:hypothetical protein
MKKLLLLLFIPLMSCDMSSSGVVGIIMSDNDVEEYSGTEAEDELTELVLELAEDYTNADFEEAKEYYSDDVKVYFNSNEVVGKENLIEGWKYEHEVFSDIKISDEYAHTNYFSDGRIWTNYWFIWSATGNFTGQKLKIKGHFDYEWKDGEIVQALGYFADEQFNKEYLAAMESNSN